MVSAVERADGDQAVVVELRVQGGVGVGAGVLGGVLPERTVRGIGADASAVAGSRDDHGPPRQRVGDGLLQNRIGSVPAQTHADHLRVATAGISGPLDARGDRRREAGAAAVQDPDRDDRRARRAADDTDRVVHCGDGPGDVGAVAIAVDAREVAGGVAEDEVVPDGDVAREDRDADTGAVEAGVPRGREVDLAGLEVGLVPGVVGVLGRVDVVGVDRVVGSDGEDVAGPVELVDLGPDLVLGAGLELDDGGVGAALGDEGHLGARGRRGRGGAEGVDRRRRPGREAARGADRADCEQAREHGRSGDSWSHALLAPQPITVPRRPRAPVIESSSAPGGLRG